MLLSVTPVAAPSMSSMAERSQLILLNKESIPDDIKQLNINKIAVTQWNTARQKLWRGWFSFQLKYFGLKLGILINVMRLAL